MNIYTRFTRWQVAALVFLVLFVVLATGIEAQDVDFSTNTPEGVATEVAPVVVVEVPTDETPSDETTDNENNVSEDTLNKFLLFALGAFASSIGGIAFLQGKSTKELGQSVPVQLFLSGAANVAGFTKALDDDKKVAEAAELSGYKLVKIGGIWVATPVVEVTPAAPQ